MNTTSLTYFECKEIFDNLEIHAINSFLIACDLLWNITSKPKEMVKETLTRISSESDLLVQDDDGWHFKNPELLLFGQAINIIHGRNLDTVPSGKSLQILFENLRDKEEHDFREQKKFNHLCLYTFD